MADASVGFHGHWLVRRLGPDCSRIELGTLPKAKHELKLLRAMGWETANIHFGGKAAARQVVRDLKRRSARWLCQASDAMRKATLADWKEWIN